MKEYKDVCYHLEFGEASPEILEEARVLISQYRRMVAGMRRGMLEAWYDPELMGARRDVLISIEGMEPYSYDTDTSLRATLLGFEQQLIDVRDTLGLKPKESLTTALLKLKAERLKNEP